MTNNQSNEPENREQTMMSNTKQQIEGIVRDYDTWCLCDCDECPGSYGYKRAVDAIDRLVTEAYKKGYIDGGISQLIDKEQK